jgi:hypothetical protein
MLLMTVWSWPPVNGRLPSHAGEQLPLVSMNDIVNHLMPVADMMVRGSGRLPQPRYAYGLAPMAATFPGGGFAGGAVVVGGAPVDGGLLPPEPPPTGRVHAWFAPPVQSQICNRVPSAELTSVASRHLLACGLISCPLVNVHC